jgi:hypothetical protein
MPEYAEFAETYQHWSVTASPYGRIETYTFFEVLGSVRGLDVLDLAAGEGRTSRMLMERDLACERSRPPCAGSRRRSPDCRGRPAAPNDVWSSLFAGLEVADEAVGAASARYNGLAWSSGEAAR